MANAKAFVPPYIDDFLAAMSAPALLSSFSNHLLPALWKLGLSIKAAKSTLSPTQQLAHLGFQVNAASCTFWYPRPSYCKCVVRASCF